MGAWFISTHSPQWEEWMEGCICMLSMKMQDQINQLAHPFPYRTNSYCIIYHVEKTNPTTHSNIEYMGTYAPEWEWYLARLCPCAQISLLKTIMDGWIQLYALHEKTRSNRSTYPPTSSLHRIFLHNIQNRTNHINQPTHSNIEYIDTSAPQKWWMDTLPFAFHLFIGSIG